MARGCSFSFGSRSGAGHWSFDGSFLLVTPDTGAPISLPVAEMSGISGDDYTVTVTVPAAGPTGSGAAGGASGAPAGTAAAPATPPPPAVPSPALELTLARLGADGPTLREELRRVWLAARAEVLRLGGTGKGKPFPGKVIGLDGASPAAEPFQALLFEDVLVIGREGRDVEALFLSLFDSVEFVEPTYCVSVRAWPGREVIFSKMAGQTAEFVKALSANRSALSEEAAASLAVAAPKLPAGGRAALAGTWLPGRLLDLPTVEAACPGFTAVLRDSWLPRLVRHDEAAYLLDWAATGSAWLGCTREKVDAEGAGEGEQPLWLLCGKGGVWFLEALSIEDRATYCFRGGNDLPILVSQLLCAPQFSKEALYNPLDQLTGDNAALAIPAQHLGFLVALRSAFQSRVIHQTPESWREGVERLTK